MIYIDLPIHQIREFYLSYTSNNPTASSTRFGLNKDTTNFLENVYGTRSHSGVHLYVSTPYVKDCHMGMMG